MSWGSLHTGLARPIIHHQAFPSLGRSNPVCRESPFRHMKNYLQELSTDCMKSQPKPGTAIRARDGETAIRFSEQW
jgi:hypothetical protein